jgi:hypothetical protein|tara:strand:- start:166 stop:570 length:405 start_codon:yes stop_codon:yes gene_type:complete
MPDISRKKPQILIIKGPIKEGGEMSLLEIRKKEMVEMEIPCSEISISIERRIQRTVIRGGEGDDLTDEGSESAVYDIEAYVEVDAYTTVMGLFRGGQPTIREPFEGGETKIAFKSIQYSAANRLLKLKLIEDIE